MVTKDELIQLIEEYDETKPYTYKKGLHRDDIEACLDQLYDEIERLRALMTWQPIETAPKDAITILGYDPTFERTYSASCCQPMFWGSAVFPASYGDYWCMDDESQDRIEPTHWMPLPEPPKEDAS